jgi:predicted metal-dependent hydrolase
MNWEEVMSTEPSTVTAPETLDIVRRDLRFDIAECDLRTWHPLGLHVAHFFNALSIFFPEGEKFFIDSVRHFRDRIRSAKLEREVKGFVGQEAMHSREHRRYNEALAAAGLPIDRLEAGVKAHLAFVREHRSPEEALAATIALEHFTAIMADVLLSHDGLLKDADPRLAAVWQWHAIEETEHKAVAFDVYQEVLGTGRAAYARRVIVMLLTTIDFWLRVFGYHFALVRADGAAWDVRGWWKLFRFLWISPGGMRRLARPWLQYFRRDFHPWQHDNFHFVQRWTAAYAASQRVSA